MNGVVSLRKPFWQVTPQAAMQNQNADLPGQLLHGMKKSPQAISTVFVHWGYWDWASNAKKPS